MHKSLITDLQTRVLTTYYKTGAQSDAFVLPQGAVRLIASLMIVARA
jgi:hypothetical protein